MSHVNYTPITLDVTSTPIDELVTTIYSWCILAPATSDYTDGEREIAFILKGNDREANIYASHMVTEGGVEYVLAHHWDRDVTDAHVRHLVAELLGKSTTVYSLPLTQQELDSLVKILQDAVENYCAVLDGDIWQDSVELLEKVRGVK